MELQPHCPCTFLLWSRSGYTGDVFQMTLYKNTFLTQPYATWPLPIPLTSTSLPTTCTQPWLSCWFSNPSSLLLLHLCTYCFLDLSTFLLKSPCHILYLDSYFRSQFKCQLLPQPLTEGRRYSGPFCHHTGPCLMHHSIFVTAFLSNMIFVCLFQLRLWMFASL